MQQADLPCYEAVAGTRRVALVQTGSFGDNVNSTLMLRPMHAHWPGVLIDVHTSTVYGAAFHNNPLIHRVVTHAAVGKEAALHLHLTVPPLLAGRGYDHVIMAHPMFNHGDWTSIHNGQLGTNLICAWVRALEHLDVPYALPLRTVLCLTDAEERRAHDFWHARPVEGYRNVVMELGAESGQTPWTDAWTVAVGRHLLRDPQTNLFISRRHSSSDVEELSAFSNGRAHFMGELSLRECLGVFNRANAFFSISSGLSNVCNVEAAKRDIRWFEVANSRECSSFPLRSDGKVFWHSSDLDGFIERLKQEGM